jgi:serine/threonine protein kinase
MEGVCRGLYHIHKNLKNPLYHLDLKPANILLSEAMEPKLADFGLSRIFQNEELTRTTKSPLGTL